VNQREIPFSGKLTATCAGGLEETLAAELRECGYEDVTPQRGAVGFAGGAEEMIRANLELRTASRVLVVVSETPIRDYDGVYKAVRRVPWERILQPEQYFAVSATATMKDIRDQRFLVMKIKDGIVDRQRDRTGRRSSVNRNSPDLMVVGYAGDGSFVLSIDSSGAPLHERGYRTEAGEAPLRETLAAGLLRLARWQPGIPFFDPFCGSGTIAIEAALIARDIAPGLVRPGYAFERWTGFSHRDRMEVQELLTPDPLVPDPTESPASAQAGSRSRIFCSDRDPRMIEIARRNATRAGVIDYIQFETADFFERERPIPAGTPGVIVTNPPFGERMTVEDLKQMYRRIGETLKERYGGWRAHVLGSDREAAKSFGLRISTRIPVYNGAIDCRLYGMDLF